MSNHVADALSCDFFMSWKDLLDSIATHLPVKPDVCQVWTPSPSMCSAVNSALRKKRLRPQAILREPKPADTTYLPSGSASLEWAPCPFSKGRATKLGSYKASPDEYVVTNLKPQAIQSGLNRLKVPYGALQRRPSDWCHPAASR